ncbi:MAG: hypothetical protein ACT4OX_15545 [Actinomycetota bacterium]
MRATVLVMLLVAACSNRDDSPRTVDVEPELTWDKVIVDADDRTLTVEVSARGEDEICNFELRVDEQPDRVVVTVTSARFESTAFRSMRVAESDPCLPTETEAVELTAPLDDRLVYDGATGEPGQMYRVADVVTPAYIPEGFSCFGPLLDSSNGRWDIPCTHESAGWGLKIFQGPFNRSDVERTGTIVARGAEIERWEGATEHRLHWIEDGLDLTVTGWDFDGPFTHDDELLRVVEGLTLPAE